MTLLGLPGTVFCFIGVVGTAIFRILLAKSDAPRGECSTVVAYCLDVLISEKESVGASLVDIDSLRSKVDGGRGAKACVLPNKRKAVVMNTDLMMAMVCVECILYVFGILK